VSVLLDRLVAAIPEEPERFRALCNSVADWPALVEAAARDGVLGLVRRELGRLGIQLPAEAHRLMERVHASETLWQANTIGALDAVLDALEAAGIRAAVLKGPALVERLYPDPSLRCSLDLDILVADADTDRAAAALEPHGYAAEAGPSARYARRHHHHVHLFGRRPPVIELHFRAYAGFGVMMAAEDLLDRARAHRTAGGARCLVLAPDDEALYLAVHAAGHCFDRLLWLYDLKLLVAQEPDLDWDAIATRARAIGVMAAFALTCDMLRRRLGVTIPSAATAHAPARLSRRIVARYVDGRIAPPAAGPMVTLRQLLTMAALCDTTSASARFVRHHVSRLARRRARRWLPALVPAEWEG
jgi:hypothetical protein